MYQKVSSVVFPEMSGINVNMMPIIMGDDQSVPKQLRGYLPLINTASFKQGDKAYLTVSESVVEAGKTQRRGGIHTEGFRFKGSDGSWGGWGGWGGISSGKGIVMASTDGRCKVWDCMTWDVDHHGAVQHELDAKSEVMDPNTMFWITDRTPHQALESIQSSERQFFRLVANDISVWWADHSTPNPLGVTPDSKVIHGSKFS